MSELVPFPLPRLLEEIRALLPRPEETFLVGGAVRDLLLGRPVEDLDLAVASGAISLARALGDTLGGAFFPLDEERGVARVVLDRGGERFEIDVADFRAADLASDLAARDFTINALALSLGDPPELIDPHGGRGDLEAGVLRLLSPEVLRDDPLRSLRAVRFAAQLGFTLEAASRNWVRQRAADLASVSGERLRDELFAALSADASGTLRRLEGLELLPSVLPEAVALAGVAQSPPHRHDVWGHTLEVVACQQRLLGWLEGGTEDLPAEPAWRRVRERLVGSRPGLARRLAAPLAGARPAAGLLLMAALFHDGGKATTRSVGEDERAHFYGHEEVGARLAAQRMAALRFAQAEIQWVSAVVRHHMRPLHLQRPLPLSDRLLHRFHRATAPVGPEVCLLSLADNLAKGEGRGRGDWGSFVERVSELLDAWFLRHDQVVAPPPLVRGRDLLEELELDPGPRVGRILRRLVEAQAGGEIVTREQALTLARRLAKGS